MQQRPAWAQGSVSPTASEPPVSAPARLETRQSRAARAAAEINRDQVARAQNARPEFGRTRPVPAAPPLKTEELAPPSNTGPAAGPSVGTSARTAAEMEARTSSSLIAGADGRVVDERGAGETIGAADGSADGDGLESRFEPAAGSEERAAGAEVVQRLPGSVVRAAPVPSGPARVALLLPLSGPNGELGHAMLNAAQLALFDFGDERFELLVQDTLGTPIGAANAAALAVSDGAELILGPLLSASVRAVEPQAQAAGINVIAFSSDRSVARRGIYVMGFLPGAEIRRVVAFARQQGITRFAALAPDNVYGVTIVDSLQETVRAVGASVTQVAFYDPNAQDYAPVVKDLANYRSRRSTLVAQRGQLEGRSDDIARRALARLEGLETLGGVPFQALLVADGGERLQRIAALLPYYDIDPKKTRMLGTGQWDVPGIGAEPAMVGGWYAAPAPGERAGFEGRYAKAYGAKPPRLATLAYDATALAAVLAQSGGPARFSDEAITSPSGYAGRDGIFRFRPEGVVERGLAVMEIHERDVEIISQPPVSFNVRGE